MGNLFEMRQDTDVARVAAALRSPAIRYRSFGNEAVRPTLPATDADPYTLLGSAMIAAGEVGTQQGMPPSEPWQAPAREADAPPPGALPSWPEPSPASGGWAEPAPVPGLAAVPTWPDSPPPPAWSEPVMPSWPDAPPPVQVPVPVQVVVVQVEMPQAEPAVVAAAPAEAAAPATATVSWTPATSAPAAVAPPPVRNETAFSLLRAADLPAAAPAMPRPSLSTLAELSVAPPPRDATAAPQRIALFPLIEALDLPGGLLPTRRATTAEPPAPTPGPPAPRLPALLAAAEIDLPLPELLRLLAADPASSADAFLALRRSPQAALPTT